MFDALQRSRRAKDSLVLFVRFGFSGQPKAAPEDAAMVFVRAQEAI